MGTSDATVVFSNSSRKAIPKAKRQRRSPELKRQVVEESFAPGASVARAHGVNANQVFHWRGLYRQGLLDSGTRAPAGLLAVRVAELATQPRVADEKPRTSSGTIQIELPKGRLRLTGAVDAETLRLVLEALRG